MLLIEGTIESRCTWMSILSCLSSDFDELIDRGVFERMRDGTWRLCFVGTLAMVRSIWLSIPRIASNRYCSESMDFAHFERLSQAIEIYSARSKMRNAGQDDLSIQYSQSDIATSPLRELEILATLIEWTTSYGFHTSDVDHYSSGFDRPIHWPKTLNSEFPLHTHTATIYANPICLEVLRHHTTVAGMQAMVLVELLEKYQAITHRLTHDSHEMVLEAKALLEFWRVSLPLSLSDLQDFLDSTNRDHEKDLISTLISYVTICEKRRNSQNSIKLYGTTAFELIWEDMCRNIFQDTCPLYAVLSNPMYQISFDGSQKSAGKQRPDIMHLFGDKAIILDAKYYCDFPFSYPDLEDVRKQIFYSMSFINEVPSISGFLFPRGSSNEVEYLGSVEMRKSETAGDGLPILDSRFPRIHCIGLPWSRVLDCYIGNSLPNTLREGVLGKVTNPPFDI